jgi:hypothetical protein
METILQDLFTRIWGVPYLPETIITAATLATVELAKKRGLNKLYAPALSVSVAIALSLLNAFVTGNTWTEAVAPGIVTGLAASGLYSYVRAPMKAKE